MSEYPKCCSVQFLRQTLAGKPLTTDVVTLSEIDTLVFDAANRIRELEAEVEELRTANAAFHQQGWRDCMSVMQPRAEAAEATLRAVGELPGKWRNGRDYSAAYFADELEILLKEQNDE